MTIQNSFRMIVDPPQAGAVNMAIDQALLDAADAGSQPSSGQNRSAVSGCSGLTLRLYQWHPATVSLGYFQNYAARHSHSASEALDLVRRTTGGGAIVHDRELTYSLTLPLTDRWSARHRELYDSMHTVIIGALSEWGIHPELWRPGMDSGPPPDQHQFLCFLRRAGGDLVLDGQKIGGSAQRRSHSSLLQHGSILLGRSTAAPELPGICELSGVSPEIDELSAEIVRRFALAWQLVPVAGELTLEEKAAATSWQTKRFGNDHWNRNR